MVITQLAYHPLLTHYLRYISTTAGRDKALRLLQYFSRFYSWYLFRTNATPAAIAPFAAIKKQFGLARKAIRLGKNVEHFKAAVVAADKKGVDPLIKYAAVGRQLGYGMYLTFDNIGFLDTAGIRKLSGDKAKTIQRQAQKAWFTGLSFSVISGLYTLWKLKERESRLSEKDAEGKLEAKKIQKERSAIQLQLLCDACDLTAPTSGLGWTSLDDGVVGLAGVVSSCIGIYGAWKKTAV